MKSRVFMLITALMLTSLLLGACNMPTRTPPFIPPGNVPPPIPQVPAANNVVTLVGSPIAAPPGVSRTIHVFAYSSQGASGQSGGPTGLSRVNITYGGNPIGTVMLDPSQSTAHGSIEWTPPTTPADYYIQADTGGQSIPNGQSVLGATLCVDDLGITIGELVAPGRLICGLLPHPGVAAPFRILRADASARMGCNTTTLEFDITVDDPSNQVYYAFADLANVSNAGFHTLATDRPGPSQFSVVADWWNTGDLLNQLAGSNTITWTAGATAHTGQLILDGPHQLILSPPTGPSFPALTAPLIPRIPSLLPYVQPAQPLNALQTDTPTATVAPNTPLPTKKPPACKKYTDEASCGAASCHWDSKTNKCSEP